MVNRGGGYDRVVATRGVPAATHSILELAFTGAMEQVSPSAAGDAQTCPRDWASHADPRFDRQCTGNPRRTRISDSILDTLEQRPSRGSQLGWRRIEWQLTQLMVSC